MLKIENLLEILEKYAPLNISYSAIENGSYDNSGLLIKSADIANKILFSLDLSDMVIERAKEIGADTVVTHHPAIYNPVKKLIDGGENGVIVNAIKNGLNVISMHLNLDMTDKGIDYYLAEGLGGRESKILTFIDGKHGYGREFSVNVDAQELLNIAKENFCSDKILLYGQGKINKVASFCGSGSSDGLECVEKGLTDADLIVSSDIPHHVLLPLLEKGKAVMIIPHYVSEQYGFYKFYKWAQAQLNGSAQMDYFVDKRFM